ncbi:MAG: histidine phosphotransfer protein HptB [Actinomycetota bacterium]|nr:histidine phosphotransfer protein HptB [Actinomycetota bacterium]
MTEVVDLDPGPFEQIRGLGQDFLESLVADFRMGTPDDLARLRQGLAAADADTAVRAAHRLKGTCLMLGAARMGALAGDVERAASEGALDRAGDLMVALERSFGDVVSVLEASVPGPAGPGA